MKIQMTDVPAATLQKMTADGVTAPNQCYHNAARIVLGRLIPEAKYVLCWVKDVAGGTHGHAVIEFQGLYYDPTLQANSGISSSYIWFRTYDYAALVALLKNKFGPDFNSVGFIPPALLPGGKVECVKV